MALPITVSGPRTDDSERNVGRNTILIAMTRNDAGFLKDILKYYAPHAPSKRPAWRPGMKIGPTTGSASTD